MPGLTSTENSTPATPQTWSSLPSRCLPSTVSQNVSVASATESLESSMGARLRWEVSRFFVLNNSWSGWCLPLDCCASSRGRHLIRLHQQPVQRCVGKDISKIWKRGHFQFFFKYFKRLLLKHHIGMGLICMLWVIFFSCNSQNWSDQNKNLTIFYFFIPFGQWFLLHVRFYYVWTWNRSMCRRRSSLWWCGVVLIWNKKKNK